MNHARNAVYTQKARNGGKLDMPVLFLHGDYDYTCETVVSRLAEPMRQDCANLSEVHHSVGALDGPGEAGRGERRHRL